MARRFIESLTDGESVEEIYLVADKQLRANRNGNLYLQIELRDRTGVLGARLWNASEAQFKSFQPGDFLVARGKVQMHQGALQVILHAFERVEPHHVELTDFLPHTEQDVNKLLERLRGALMKSANPYVRALCECFLMDDDFMRAFAQVPAGVRVHHAYVGGLLEHTVTMLDLAEKVASLYPGVDRDLLLVGVFLHDAGKARELARGRVFGYTDEGQLLGHLAIGLEMVSAKAREAEQLMGEPFPPELLLRVKHMVLSHHGTLEFGSPKVPMTPEAIALHAIDMLDTRIHMFLRELREDRNKETTWTQFNNALQRRVFKGGAGPDGSAFSAAPEAYD